MSDLYKESAINAKFSYLKSMNFVSGLLEVYNRRYEMNIKKYLESGNEEDLGPELQNLKIKDYGKILELLVNLVSEGREQAAPTVNVQVNNANAGLSTQNIEELFALINSKDGE